MRKMCLLLAALTFSFANATIITVDNKENSGADYTDLQTAIDNATAGDTIYVAGSPTNYGNITIDKQLVLFGQGYNPNNQLGNATLVSDITFNFVTSPVASDPSGSHVEGFEAHHFNIDDNDGAMNNITIRRNRFVSGNSNIGNGSNNITIENNVLGTVNLSSSPTNVQATNIIVRNNIITNDFESAASASVLVSNNLFVTASAFDAFNACDFIIVSNNIFFGFSVGTTTADCDACTFNNNISFSSGSTAFGYATNTASGNLESTDPMFESATFGDNYLFAADYRLATGSPGIGAGSDATDIGIYGGSAPFPIEDAAGFFTSPFPTIPQVFEMNILNAAVPENGTLNVEIKAKKID